jgi:hypothetical protein
MCMHNRGHQCHGGEGTNSKTHKRRENVRHACCRGLLLLTGAMQIRAGREGGLAVGKQAIVRGSGSQKKMGRAGAFVVDMYRRKKKHHEKSKYAANAKKNKGLAKGRARRSAHYRFHNAGKRMNWIHVATPS